MSICVKNEIGKLKKVLLHRPGDELLHLIPESLTRLLFDDIPYLDIAAKEHDYFADKLRENDIEVIYLEDLVTDVLKQDSGIKEQFIQDFINMSGDIAKYFKNELTEYFMSKSDIKNLVTSSMTGINYKELGTSKSKLAKLVNDDTAFILDPMPNLYFTRDTFSCIGNGVSLNRMKTNTRMRESIYGQYIFKYHPEYKNTPKYYMPDSPFSIEGGDILNLSEKTILVGISERTSPEAIEYLANNLFYSEESTVENIIAIEIPSTRAFMHLDTVFTQIDINVFTVHPHIMSTLRCFKLYKSKSGISVTETYTKLKNLLAEYMQVDSVKLLYCGNDDSIAAKREQWNDGSNTLCIAPGKVVVYDRNVVTNALLEDNGIECIKIKSSELSRGRGGPRCMSMPFDRELI